MKFLSILALAATALAAVTGSADTNAEANNMEQAQVETAAAPQGEAGTAEANDWYQPHHHHRCRPGTYSCTERHDGWRVCDWSGHWVFGGYCGHDEECKFNRQSGSPYCLPRHHY